MNIKKTRLSRSVVLFIIAPLLLLRTAPLQAADAVEEKEACSNQLRIIFHSIQDYRKEHKELPDWLSDLIPKYLKDEDVLLCPVTKRTGKMDTYGLDDPKVKQCYLYEFCAKPVPANLWGGDQQATMRDWKRLQMALVGGEVPILRCNQHDPVLNVGFDGRLYESMMDWEHLFTNIVESSALGPTRLKARFGIVDGQAAGLAADGGPALVGKEAPPIRLKLLNGGEFDLETFRGTNGVIVEFWSTWCAPCAESIPALAAIADNLADKGLRYVAVNFREKPEIIKPFLNRFNLDLTVPLDSAGETARQYGVRGIPTVILIDRAGVVYARHTGYFPSMREGLVAEIQQALLDPKSNSSDRK